MPILIRQEKKDKNLYSTKNTADTNLPYFLNKTYKNVS